MRSNYVFFPEKSKSQQLIDSFLLVFRYEFSYFSFLFYEMTPMLITTTIKINNSYY